jgi:hypothetical protein
VLVTAVNVDDARANQEDVARDFHKAPSANELAHA